MARTPKAVLAVAPNVGNDIAAQFTAIDAANGWIVTAAFQAKDITKLVLEVKNTAGAPKNVTLKAAPATYPRNQYIGAGDLVVAVPATTGERLIVISDSARFEQADESLWIDFEAGMTGIAAVYKLP